MTADGQDWIEALLREQRLPDAYRANIDAIYRPLAGLMVENTIGLTTPLVVGLCGPQGSGKSTGALVLRRLLAQQGFAAAVLSLDDLYQGRAARQALAAKVHPLLATRGPPGTHDIGLALRTMDSLAARAPTALPRFDKASDDRMAEADWPRVTTPVDCIILEGWCVGARPQPPGDLVTPINELEAREDPDAIWRSYANACLAGPYQLLFDRIDLLLLIKAPGFGCVLEWRLEQEHKLRAARPEGAGLMSDSEVARFVQHYERITRFIDVEMAARADAVVVVDRQRGLERLDIR